MVNERTTLEELQALLVTWRISRASFLRLLVGEGLSLVPTSLAALGRVSSAQMTADPLGVSPITLGGEYPIGIWWPPPPDKTEVGRYRQIAEAGFNFVIGGNGVANIRENREVLEVFKVLEADVPPRKLRLLLWDGQLKRIIDGSTAGSASTSGLQDETPSIMRYLLDSVESEPDSGAEGEVTPEAVLDPKEQLSQRLLLLWRNFGGYPALAGLNLYDEPNSRLFEILGFAKEEVLQRWAPEQLPYVNAWPSYASPNSLGSATYEEYLQRYIIEVAPPLLSFDHYPLLSGTQITSDYFYNWAVIREYSLKFGVPSWVFIQSVDFDGSQVGLAQRRRPTEPEILWQVNMSLAYGAKGIQYFTYWTPKVEPEDPIQFGEALVSVDGELTPLYDYADRVNTYLSVIGKVLLPLTSESVVHAQEESSPRRAKACTGRDGWVDKVSGSPVILSRFYRFAGEGERHLFVANRSFLEEAKTDVKLSNRVREVFELNSQTGEYARVIWHANPNPRKLRLSIAPGGARLFLLRTE